MIDYLAPVSFVLSIGLLLAALSGCGSPELREPVVRARPLIGITGSVRSGSRGATYSQLDRRYARCVVEAGGVPVLLPAVGDDALARQYVQRLDGLILSGGQDIPPSAYGQTPHKTTRIMTAARYEFERRLIERWLEIDKPLLGVCLGLQFVNVVKGGSLWQDIPSQIGRDVSHRGTLEIRMTPGSRIRAIHDAERITVPVSHHQAARRIADGLTVTARSADDVIMALEAPDRPSLLLLQWHPERDRDDGRRLAPFRWLVNACSP